MPPAEVDKNEGVDISSLQIDTEARQKAGEKLYQKAHNFHKPGLVSRLAYFVLCINRNKLAITYYQQASKELKLAGDWELAGLNHMELAETFLDDDAKQDAATSYAEAGKMYMHIPEMQKFASEAFQNAADIHVGRGKQELAAKLLKYAGDWSTQKQKLEPAIDLYNQSSKLYGQKNVQIERTQITLKVAQIRVVEEDYMRAVKRYEEVAKTYLNSDRYVLGAKNILMNAVLCYLAKGKINKAKRALQRYVKWDQTLKGSKQFYFLQAIMEAIQKDDLEVFDAQGADIMNLIRMDAERTKLYLEIRDELALSAEEARKARKRAAQERRQQALEAPPPPPQPEISEALNAALDRLVIG